MELNINNEPKTPLGHWWNALEHAIVSQLLSALSGFRTQKIDDLVNNYKTNYCLKHYHKYSQSVDLMSIFAL
jgi:hypothetical protein